MNATKLTITSVTKDSPGAGQFTIVGTYTAATAYTVTRSYGALPNTPSVAQAFGRAFVLASQALIISQGASLAVAINIEDLAEIAYGIEEDMTFSAGVATQPADDECVASSTAAVFTVEPDSELPVTYQWQYSADGSTGWTNATGTVNGCAYSGGTTATLTCTPTTTGQDGYYHRCTITNSLGSANSSAALLTIT